MRTRRSSLIRRPTQKPPHIPASAPKVPAAITPSIGRPRAAAAYRAPAARTVVPGTGAPTACAAVAANTATSPYWRTSWWMVSRITAFEV